MKRFLIPAASRAAPRRRRQRITCPGLQRIRYVRTPPPSIRHAVRIPFVLFMYCIIFWRRSHVALLGLVTCRRGDLPSPAGAGAGQILFRIEEGHDLVSLVGREYIHSLWIVVTKSKVTSPTYPLGKPRRSRREIRRPRRHAPPPLTYYLERALPHLQCISTLLYHLVAGLISKASETEQELAGTIGHGGGEEGGARDAVPVPVLGPHQPDAQAGGAAALARGARHLRQHGPQPPAPQAPARPRRVPLRVRPRRARRRRPRRARQDGQALPVPAEDLQGPAAGPGAAAREARGRAARHLRRHQRPRQLRARRRRGPPRALLRALGHQRRRLRLHPPPAPAPPERIHAAQRRDVPDERVSGHADRLDRGDADGAARRRLQLRADAGPDQLRAARGGGGGQQLRQGAGPHPQHLPRARGRRAGRARGRVPARVHHRAPRRGHAPPRRPPRRLRAEPLGGGRGLHGVAGRAAGAAGLRPLRQLRQPRGAVAGPARGVRVGARGQQPPVPLGRPPRPRRRRPRHGRPAGRLLGRDQGPVFHRRVVRAGAGAAAPRRGGLPHAQRLELHHGEHLGRRAHDLRARVRGPVHQLPVRVRGVGHRASARRGAAAGAGGGTRRGAHGRRQEGPGDEAQRRRVEGSRRGRHGARRVGVREPRQAGGAAAGGGIELERRRQACHQRPPVTIGGIISCCHCWRRTCLF